MNELLNPGGHFHADQLGQGERDYDALPVHEALAYSIKKQNVAGGRKDVIVDLTVTLAGDYPGGGIVLTAKSCGVDRIDGVSVLGTDKALLVQWDPVADKLKAWKGNGAAVFVEAAGADIAGGIVRLRVVGDGATGF